MFGGKSTKLQELGGKSDMQETKGIFLASPMNKSYTIAGLTLTVLALVVVFVIRPTLKVANERRQEMKIYSRYIEFLDKRFSTVSNLQNEYEGSSEEVGFKQKMALVQQLYPANKDTSTLVSIFMELAEDYQVEVESITISDEENNRRSVESDYESLSKGNANIFISSNQTEDLFAYVAALDELPIFASIQNLSLSEDQESDDYLLNVNLPIYFIKEEYSLVEEEAGL